MTVVKPPAKVLVSGASGFIAIWVVRSLLERGYAVRGTVRSREKGNYLKEMFKEYGDKFEAVIVKDISSVRSNYFWPEIMLRLLVGWRIRRGRPRR
jgi:uncharacterized protein YbjT (DUF2867 family)